MKCTRESFYPWKLIVCTGGSQYKLLYCVSATAVCGYRIIGAARTTQSTMHLLLRCICQKTVSVVARMEKTASFLHAVLYAVAYMFLHACHASDASMRRLFNV